GAAIRPAAKILARTAVRRRGREFPVARFSVGPVASGAVIPAEPRRPRGILAKAARCVPVMTARRVVIALAVIAPAGKGLAGSAALGKFLVGPPRRAGTALAAGRPIPPATRGSVVFIVVAGHE